MNDASYAELVELATAARQQRDQAAGAAAELERRLLDEFGLKSLAEAKAELVRLEAAEKKATAAADAEYARLMDKWKDKLP